MRTVLVVGSMAFDDLELPTGAFKDVIGGSATFSSIAASVFCKTRVVAVVGQDFPESALTTMRDRSVDTAGIERANGKTFRWAGRYSENLASRVTLDTQLNVFADFRPVIPAAYKGSSILMLGNIHPALQLDVLRQVESPELVVADTMNFWITGEPAALGEVLKEVDLLIINDEELLQLTGIANIRKAARDVLRRGPRRLVVKRGEHGALLFDEAGVFAAPGFPLEDVVDPTGAGDSFAGGLVGYLASEAAIDPRSLRRAMIHGTATASYCVEAVGTTRIAKLTETDVEERVRQIRALYDMAF